MMLYLLLFVEVMLLHLQHHFVVRQPVLDLLVKTNVFIVGTGTINN